MELDLAGQVAGAVLGMWFRWDGHLAVLGLDLGSSWGWAWSWVGHRLGWTAGAGHGARLLKVGLVWAIYRAGMFWEWSSDELEMGLSRAGHVAGLGWFYGCGGLIMRLGLAWFWVGHVAGLGRGRGCAGLGMGLGCPGQWQGMGVDFAGLGFGLASRWAGVGMWLAWAGG